MIHKWGTPKKQLFWGKMLQGKMLHWEKCYIGENVTGENVTGEFVTGENVLGENVIHPSKPPNNHPRRKIVFLFSAVGHKMIKEVVFMNISRTPQQSFCCASWRKIMTELLEVGKGGWLRYGKLISQNIITDMVRAFFREFQLIARQFHGVYSILIGIQSIPTLVFSVSLREIGAKWRLFYLKVRVSSWSKVF